mmetsp:Transcript_11983/g.30575  ORF Transcript_11983/g.30575 Transcript_11983/m.30575 type:complete len:488 (+) Transcript_11983:385-1848(+)
MDRAQELLDQLVYLGGDDPKHDKKQQRNISKRKKNEQRKSEKQQTDGGDDEANQGKTSKTTFVLPKFDLAQVLPKKRKLKGRGSVEDGQPEPASACRTWSRDDLLRRLRTYSSRTWFCKPKSISSVVCASKGWSNVGLDTLECVACKARAICPAIISPEPKAIAQAAQKFLPLLDSLHHKLCPWKGNACELSLLKFPPTTPEKLIQDFECRLEELLTLPQLPLASLPVDDGPAGKANPMEFTTFQERPLLKSIFVTNHKSQKSWKKTYYDSLLALALCGWSISSKAKIAEESDDGSSDVSSGSAEAGNYNVLECSLCGAVVGVWNFDTAFQRPSELEHLAWKGRSGYSQFIKQNRENRGNVRQLRETIAGGTSPLSDSLNPTFSFSSNRSLSQSPKSPDCGEKSKSPGVSKVAMKDPKAYRKGGMDPLNTHRSFCPWSEGWVQCFHALQGNTKESYHHGENRSNQDQKATPNDLLKMLQKVQKTIPG